ncbi:MAG: serine hydrolase [Paludibacter sp.]|nr:serine hydrolase [Paludibacter sp.]
MISKGNITLGEVVKRLAKCPLEHDPGEKFTYGMSMDVLGYLIETVSGMPISEFFQKRIFEPLGMNDTYFYLPDNKKDRIVTLYEKREPNSLLVVNNKENNVYQTFPVSGAKTLCSTGAGLNGTIEDSAKFCQMILNDGQFNNHRILGRKTFELMKKNAVGDLRGEIGFGLAFEIFTKRIPATLQYQKVRFIGVGGSVPTMLSILKKILSFFIH